MPAPQSQPDRNQQDMHTRVAVLGRQDGQRSAPSTLNETERTVGVILTTETPVRTFDWRYGEVDEVLLMSGLELPATGQVPLLDAHSRWSVNDQLGSLRNFEVHGDALYAVAQFSSTAEEAFTKVREGHLTDVSVGWRLLAHTYVEKDATEVIDGKSYTGPLKIVTRWEVKEGSFVPIGADKNAKARAASDHEPCNQENSPMPAPAASPDKGKRTDNSAPATTPAASAPQNETATPVRADAAPAAAQAATPSAHHEAAPSAESIRAEIADILVLGRMHNCVELAEEAIRSGTSLDKFRAQVLDSIASRSEQHAPNHRPTVEVGISDSDKFRDALSDSFVMRAFPNNKPEKPAPGAEQFRGYSLMEIARECLRRAGLPASGNPLTMVGRAFTETTSDFPNILADTAQKSLDTGVREVEETFELWTGVTSAQNFRQHLGVGLNAFTNLKLVPEGHEYEHGYIKDRGIRYNVDTYGRLFSITRQAIINDDLNAFTEIPAAMGRAGMRTRGNMVYDLLLENPIQPDGYALFSAEHKNLAPAGTAITIESFGQGLTAMGTHTGDQGETLNMSPRYLLVPVGRQAEAFSLFNDEYIGTQAEPTKRNPWRGFATPIIDARLDKVDTLPWFMAGPQGFSINCVYLFGDKGFRLERRQGFTIDGTEFKISNDFGVYVKEWLGLYKNPGVASTFQLP
jgi:hypothetical protein